MNLPEKTDHVQRLLWVLTVIAIVALLVGRGRLGAWEKPAQGFLGGCLTAMGLRMFQRLTARGWWKGDWRSTLRRQGHEEWTALLVSLNVTLIGLVCLAVVAIRKG